MHLTIAKKFIGMRLEAVGRFSGLVLMKIVGTLLPRASLLWALIVAGAVLAMPGSLVLAAGDSTTSGAGGVAASVACDPGDDCTIPYEYLSSEATDPYLVFGKPPVKRADIKAAKRWPNARSCLVRSQRDAEQPDIAKLDWGRMRWPEDIEVCMFRIAASIGSPEGVLEWFRAQGLSNGKIERYDFANEERIRVSAGNNIKNSGKTYLTEYWPLNRIRLWSVYSEVFSIVWSSDGDLINASHGSNIL